MRIFAVIGLLLLCSCTNEKCVKSHQEAQTTMFQFDPANNPSLWIPMTTYYDVCDQWETK